MFPEAFKLIVEPELNESDCAFSINGPLITNNPSVRLTVPNVKDVFIISLSTISWPAIVAKLLTVNWFNINVVGKTVTLLLLVVLLLDVFDDVVVLLFVMDDVTLFKLVKFCNSLINDVTPLIFDELELVAFVTVTLLLFIYIDLPVPSEKLYTDLLIYNTLI